MVCRLFLLTAVVPGVVFSAWSKVGEKRKQNELAMRAAIEAQRLKMEKTKSETKTRENR